jgi:N-acetylneuraminate synthase
MSKVKISDHRSIGAGEPVYIIAEIGINHNGSLELVKKMIDAAVEAHCDAVKFQKRTPEICTPKDQWQIERDTPWGRMTYIDYRRKVEFSLEDYQEIDSYCKQKGINWFASPWDEPSVDFLVDFKTVIIKLASASLTDLSLMKKAKASGLPLMISTGMSSMNEIETVINIIGTENLMIAHTTSAYPCDPRELNLKMIQTLANKYPGVPIGYSGHEVGLATTVAAVALGASFIERHFTLDRAMWGSDQAASVEPGGMAKLVRDIRDTELALGDGIKKVYDSELAPMKRLRRAYLS